MKADKILQTSLIDILFENRNKTYGAYELRVNYPKRMRNAIAFGTLTVITSFLLFTSFTQKGKDLIAKIIGTTSETKLNTAKPDEKKKIEKVEQKKIGKKATEVKQNPPNSIPKFVKNPNFIPNNPNLASNPNGNPFAPSNNYEGPIGDEGNELKTKKDSSVVDEPTKIEIKPIVPEKELPSFEASYIGGKNAFGNYLQEKLSDEAIDDNMDKKITVSFWIETDGSITNINTEGNDDAAFVQKTIRVFQKMKKWQAAINKGELIRTHKIIPITIVLPQD